MSPSNGTYTNIGKNKLKNNIKPSITILLAADWEGLADLTRREHYLPLGGNASGLLFKLEIVIKMEENIFHF